MATSIKTRYVETAQDGIVHHSSFIVYLEMARIDFFSSFGIDINDLEKKKIFNPVVSIAVRYKKPLFSLENIVVKVFCTDVSRVKFSLGYKILRDEKCVAEGSSAHCFVNASFSPIPIPPSILESLKKSYEENQPK